MKKIFKFLFHRMVMVGLLIALQFLALIVVIWRFENYFVYFYSICLVLSAVAVLKIINDRSNPEYKLAWIIPILLFPIFGGLFYLMFGGNTLSKKARKEHEIMEHNFIATCPVDYDIYQEIEQQNPIAATQCSYLLNKAFSPVYQNTRTQYLQSGEVKFERLKEELEKAEKFIFIEYFIIQEGIMWNTILEILIRKVKQGVDVRVIYDDVGCLMTLPYRYDKKLESYGIRCCVFNPFRPVLSVKMNNRDHRKIVVIDGHTGFTGGINLADEYINAYEKHGHWYDVAIMLKGDAVSSLTMMFIALWDSITKQKSDYSLYQAPESVLSEVGEQDGYVQPYCDTPFDGERVGETVYLNMIYAATKYVYINTPYLIIDNEMITALTTAAKRGVDVRIVTPHVPDKWYVHAVSRANYDALVEDGVKIYEYTPGFVHAKTFVADDQFATVGTINLDYRSLYLHMECGVWLYQSSSVLAIKEHYLNMLKKCEEVTLETCRQVSWLRKLCRSILRIFAPLM